MSITDYEIMGGVGYGSDPLAGMDLRAAIAEQAFPNVLNKTFYERRNEVPFKADGKSTMLEQYQPIQQEPMGRNYRPDQFKSSEYSYDYYKYPAFNENDTIYGIDFDRSYARSNALAVESAFQTENARYGGQIDINRFADKKNNSDDITSRARAPATIGSSIENFVGSTVDFCKDNNNITIVLIVMMFLIFVIVSYLQSCHITQLQKMLKRVLKK